MEKQTRVKREAQVSNTYKEVTFIEATYESVKRPLRKSMNRKVLRALFGGNPYISETGGKRKSISKALQPFSSRASSESQNTENALSDHFLTSPKDGT